MIPNGRENTGYPVPYPEPYAETCAPISSSNSAFHTAFTSAFPGAFSTPNRSSFVRVLFLHDDAADPVMHIAQEKERVNVMRKQQQAKSDERLAEAVAKAFSDLENAHVVNRQNKAPLNADFLFYLFMDAKHCDAIVGDLEERHRLIHKKFGARRAKFWYWSQTIRSVGPIVWAWAKKLIMKPVVAAITWAAAKHLLNDGSWLVMVAEVWKRIRS